MEPITREVLDEALDKQEKRLEKYLEKQGKHIEELFEAKLSPIVKNVERHEKTLYGKDGSKGIVRSVITLIWGYGLYAAVLIFFAKKFFE